MATKKTKREPWTFTVLSMLPWAFYALALIFTFYAVSHGEHFWESYLRSVVFFCGGIAGIWAAIGHFVFPGRVSKSIGWKPSPFQTEMAATNLAIGVTGIISYFAATWQMPVALVIAILFAGCVYTHIKDRIKNKNEAPCNSGPMLYNTIVVSLSLFIAILVLAF